MDWSGKRNLQEITASLLYFALAAMHRYRLLNPSLFNIFPHSLVGNLENMKAVLLVLVVVLAVLQVAFGFAPISSVARTSTRGSTVLMSGKTRELRDRIKSVKNTRRITEAMRLVAAARVRRAQDAVLKGRPVITQLQSVRPPP